MELSVIIVNYNVRQFLENALSSIERALEGIESEIFVVDNASDDGSVEMVKTKFPRVRIIRNAANFGFARANNLALKEARGKYLLLINPDTVVQEDTFRVMMKFFEEHPEAGLAGCRVMNPDGSFQLACRRSFPTPWVAFSKIFGLSTLFPKSRIFGRYNLTYLNPFDTYQVDAVSGAFMMMPRNIYEEIGGLDETFFMYGEDLDWCYRVSKAGYKVYYVHSTKIIHFKGESTKRSEIDEIRLFYTAMQLFVEKHFSHSMLVELVLTLGIAFRASLAFLVKGGRSFVLAAIDILFVNLALTLGDVIYFGRLFPFPEYAYPLVYTVPALVIVGVMYSMGVYTTHRYSVLRAAGGVIVGYVMISALVFFAKDFAFSRAVVAISGVLNLVLLPGWRLVVGRLGRSKGVTRKTLFGRRTIIVGTGPSAEQVLRKLRARVDDGYDVVGFVDTHHGRIGEKVAGLEIVGSMENVGKVIDDQKVSEVIFSTDGISYSDILSVIARSQNRSVNFRLVPTSLEAIIGKTRIDELDTLPLVDIEYNIQKVTNRIIKRAFDIGISSVLLLVAYPFSWLRSEISGNQSSLLLLLPEVFLGRMSLVGRPLSDDTSQAFRYTSLPAVGDYSVLGPRGLTGLVQINHREDLEEEEIERYKLYYAKNQSLVLDSEIIMKTIMQYLRREGGN